MVPDATRLSRRQDTPEETGDLRPGTGRRRSNDPEAGSVFESCRGFIMKNRIITNSAFCAYRDCPMRYRYRYDERLRKKETKTSPALAFGSAVHDHLDYFYQNKAMPSLEPINSVNVDGKTFAIIRQMLTSYVALYGAADVERHTDFIPEKEFLLPHPTVDGFHVAGKIDMLARDLKGDWWLWEHKTTSRIDSGYLSKLWTNSQIVSYFWAARELGYDCRGIIYNVLPKPLLRQKKAETEEEYIVRVGEWYQKDPFWREPMVITEGEIAQWRTDLNRVTRGISWGVGDWRNTNRCFDWSRACDYVDLCRNPGNDVLKSLEYNIADKVHFELSDEANAINKPPEVLSDGNTTNGENDTETESLGLLDTYIW